MIPRKIVKIVWDNVFGELLTACESLKCQGIQGNALGKIDTVQIDTVIDTVLHVTIFFTIEK